MCVTSGSSHSSLSTSVSLRMDGSCGAGYEEGVAFLRCWDGSPGGSPQTRRRKGEAEAVAHTQEQLDAPDVFIEGPAQHDSRRHADRVTGPWPRLASDTQEGAALEKDQHQDRRQGRAGRAGSGEGEPREGQRPRSKGSPGLRYCTPLATGQEVQYCNSSPLARGFPFSDP